MKNKILIIPKVTVGAKKLKDKDKKLDINIPGIEIKGPEIDIPKIDIKAPKIEVEGNINIPNIEIKEPKIEEGKISTEEISIPKI